MMRSTSGPKPLSSKRVGFVQDEEAQLMQFQRALIEQVEHSSWRPDEHLAAAADFRLLRLVRAPADDGDRRDALWRADLLGDVGDLDGQFTSWSQHHDLD